MKDDKLEKEFGEYFKNVNTPDNITGDAKKYVKPKNAFLPKFVKFASVAASFALVFAVAVTLFIRSYKKPSDETETPLPDAQYTVYTDKELTTETASAYSISQIDKSLKFIENFAIASNANVSLCEVKYNGGKLALAVADINVIDGFTRDETRIYVEFTEEKVIYDGLTQYFDGEIKNYLGAEYYLTESVADNGEPNFKLHVNYAGLKYYFDVTSSDETAYIRYLDLVVN